MSHVPQLSDRFTRFYVYHLWGDKPLCRPESTPDKPCWDSGLLHYEEPRDPRQMFWNYKAKSNP